MENAGRVKIFRGLSSGQRCRRLAFLVMFIIVLFISTICLVNGIKWIDKPFPGFLISERLVVSGGALYHWSGVKAGLKYTDKILKVNNQDVNSIDDIMKRINNTDEGTPINYVFERDGQPFELTIATMRVTLKDFFGIFVAPFLSGIIYLLMGSLVFIMKPDAKVSIPFLLYSFFYSAFMILTFDIMVHQSFTILYFFSSQTLFCAAGIHLSMFFPEEKSFIRKYPYFQAVPYIISIIFIISFIILPLKSHIFAKVYGFSFIYIPLYTLILLGSSFYSFFKSTSILARQRGKVTIFGLALAFPIPGLIFLLSFFGKDLWGIQIPHSFFPIPLLIFPACIAYAIGRHNLFDVDVFIKRTIGYVIMTIVVGSVFLLMHVLVDMVVHHQLDGGHHGPAHHEFAEVDASAHHDLAEGDTSVKQVLVKGAASEHRGLAEGDELAHHELAEGDTSVHPELVKGAASEHHDLAEGDGLAHHELAGVDASVHPELVKGATSEHHGLTEGDAPSYHELAEGDASVHPELVKGAASEHHDLAEGDGLAHHELAGVDASVHPELVKGATSEHHGLTEGDAPSYHELAEGDASVHPELVKGVTSEHHDLAEGGTHVQEGLLSKLNIGDKIVPVLSALLIVFCFNPVHHSVQHFVDKLFYRKKYDYKSTVTSISHTLNSMHNGDSIIKQLISTVRDKMFVDTVGVILLEPQGKTVQTRFVGDESDTARDHLEELNIAYDDPLLALISVERKMITKYDIAESPHYSNVRESCGKRFHEMESSIAIPLIYKDQVKGVFSIGHTKSGHFFTGEDIDLLKTLGNHGIVAIENARLFQENMDKVRMEEDLKIGHEIQMSMLPKKTPEIEGFKIAARSISAREVGGDFYDFIGIGEDGECGSQAIVIGDVSGKGVSAGLIMAASRSTFRALTEDHSSVEKIMNLGNQRLNNDIKDGMFVALLYAVLSPKDKTMILSNAGQTSPIICSDGESKPAYITTEGDTFPQGILPDCKYLEKQVALKKGDTVVFYTDGVVEAMNEKEELYGFDRFMEAIDKGRNLDATLLLENLMDEITNFVGGAEAHDDITVIVLKVE